MRHVASLLLSLGLLGLPGTQAGSSLLQPAPQPAAVRLTPRVITMGAFYNGVTGHVEGLAPAGTQVVMVIRGENLKETLNKKSRVGPIWATTGKVHISGAPSLFLSFSPSPIQEILSQEAIATYGLSQEAIENRLSIEPKMMDQPLIRAQFIKMKTQEDVYQVHAGAIHMDSPRSDGRAFSLDFRWPKRAPPGSYELRVYQCKDGKVVSESAVPLQVVKAGFPAWMADLARNRAAVYGGLAVMAALLAGLGIDFVTLRFGRRGTKH